jgi:hypothetical protein
MLRIVIIDAIFFLMPFAAYALWLMMTRRTITNPDDWQVRTIAWLALIGATLMVIVLTIFVHLDPGRPGGIYVPPRLEDGVIVPGHILYPDDVDPAAGADAD